MSYAVRHFFMNGGRDALIVRVHRPLAGEDSEEAVHETATITLPGGDGDLVLEASSPGFWGGRLQAAIDYDTKDPADPNLFNLVAEERNTEDDNVRASEEFRNLSVDPDASRFATKVLEFESDLVRVQGDVAGRPDASPVDDQGQPVPTPASGGGDGDTLTDAEVEGNEARRVGIYALDKADLFNMLCLPPLSFEGGDIAPTTWGVARGYCEKERAMLIVDPPSSWNDPADVKAGIDDFIVRHQNAVLYFPRVKMADPLRENRLQEYAPCGVVAGIFARTDANRGVWKAPAGIEATLTGVRELSYKMTDGENGQLNPLGINCLRAFPVTGKVLWGARTMRGADRLADQWKYTPVRRLALYIEESLYRGTQWVVFEPNDEPLWAQIRMNVGTFMHDLFRQGAFQGSSPRDAYLVKCDKETTTQSDINRGIVNILVGFAPLKPAEFVIIQIKQLAGQTQA